MAKKYNNQIKAGSGFSLSGEYPIDDRTVVQTLADLEESDTSLVKTHSAYEGMQVYVIDDKKTYEYKNTGTTDTPKLEWKAISYEHGHPYLSDGTAYAAGVTQGGVAVSAAKFNSARLVKLTGDVTGEASADGSSGWSITTTVVDDLHNHIIPNVDGLQEALAGKAPTSHASTVNSYGAASDTNYGHAKASTTSPKASGVLADLGNETSAFARGDHVHPFPENINIAGYLESSSLMKKSHCYLASADTTAGDQWYRIYVSRDGNSDGDGEETCIFTLGRSYNSPQNENYCFSVSVSYYGDVNITQLSGARGISYLIDKIRIVSHDSHNHESADEQPYYIDFLLKGYTNNDETFAHSLYVYGIGSGYFQDPTPVQTDIPEHFISREFKTVVGFKTDEGLTGKSLSVDNILRSGYKFQNVATCSADTTVLEIVIKTKIPFSQNYPSSGMPVIHLHGYAYGQQAPIDINVVTYVWENKFHSYSAASSGAWSPPLYLFTYKEDGTDYIALAIDSEIYYPRFTVDLTHIWYHDLIAQANGWRVEYRPKNDESTTLIPADNQNNKVSVQYKAISTNITGNSGSADKIKIGDTSYTLVKANDGTGSTGHITFIV